MRKLTNIGCGVVLVLMVCVVIVAGVLSLRNTPVASSPVVTRSPSRNNAILRAAPGSTSVQMFDELRDGSDVKVITFPDGFGCIKLGEPVPHAGGSMYFYKLNCNGRIGYVNAQWVDD